MKKNKLVSILFLSVYLILNMISSESCAQSNFQPSDIAGLKLWLRGDSVQMTTPPLVDKCFDKSSAANHAIQSTASLQPVSVSSNLNGHKTIQFDGTDDYVSFAEIADIRTVFWVVKEDNTASSNYRSLLGHTSAFDFVRGDNKQLWNSSYSSSSVLLGASKINRTIVNGTTTLVSPTHYSIISLVTTGNVKGENFSNERNIGGRVWFGNLAELIVYNQPLTAAQVIQVETYLNDKYAPVVNLGADISSSNFCDTTLKTGEWFKSFLWSTGQTTQKISINKPGTYWVKVVDEFDRISQDTINVTYPVVNYTGDGILCPGTLKVWDTKYSKKLYTFKWQDNSTDSIFTITQPGKYAVTITETLTGCSITSDTAIITLDNIATTISLGNDTSFCAGNAIGLVKGASSVVSYLWSTGSTSSTIPITTTGKYWLTVKSVNNCSATDTINVVVTGIAPTADFAFANTCLKNITAFTDLSVAPVGQPIVSWSWAFGDLSTSVAQHPTHVYPDTGKFTVKLIVQTANCAASVTRIVHVYPRPKVSFTAADFFSNIPTSFNAQAVASGYPITQWNWNFGDPGSGGSNTSILQNPTHIYNAIGNYLVTLVGQNTQGCTDTVTKNILIDIKPGLGPISQLKVWLRADTLVTLNPDSTISAWKDIKGGYNFTSPSLQMSPPLKADMPALNNNAYANFKGGKGLLSQTAVKLKNNLTTVLIVGKQNVASYYGYWVCYGVSSMGNWELYEVQLSGRLAFIHCNDNLGAGIDASGSGSGAPAGNTTVLDKNPAVIMGTVNPGNSQWDIYENFVNKHTAFSGPYTQATSALMSLGYRTDVFQYGNFKMAELMVFDSTLSAAQFSNVKNYLQKRYSKKVSLGPDIVVSYGVCNTVLKVADPLFTSYKWSTGATTQSIAVHKTGTYWVDVTDIYGFQSTDTIKVNYTSISSIANSTICPGTSLVWNTNLSKKGYTFKWQDNSTDSLLTITQAGKYYVTITDTLGCSLTSDSVTIKVDNIASVISLGADTALCSGNQIGLKTGASQVANYLWSTGSINTTIPIVSTGDYWLTVKSVNNCFATDTIHVVVNGVAPSSNFSFLNTCLKNTTVFTDLSTPPAGETIASWSWNFGDSFTSSVPSPVHVYADTGKYTVQLLVTTPAGCSQLHTKTVNIYPRPKVNFSVINLCEDVNTTFTGQVTTYGYPVSKWSWDFGDPTSGPKNTSALQNPAHLFGNGGTYPVRLIVENNKGCTDTVVKNILINPSPVTDFSFSLACKDDTVLFKDLTTLPAGTTNAGNYWSFGNGTSTLLNPTHVFPASVKYTVMHIVTASNGCKDTMIKSVDVHASPTARFANSTSCESSPTLFTDQSFIPTGTVTGWQWTFENTGHAIVKNPQYTFTKTGNVIVKQVVISDFGCKDSISKLIVVYPRPVAQFTVTPEYGNPGQSVKFTNTSTGAVTYSWDFDDGGTSKLVNPTHIYNDTGSYVPSLIATSSVGCNDTAFGKVLILKRFMDVAITGIKAEVQNGGGVLLNDYLNVHVDLVNRSTADVFALDLYMETNDGAAIKEAWSGKFLKGDVMGYDFKSAPNLKAGDHFVCVYALNPNGLKDEVPADNKWCEALDVSEFKVIAPYPNPTEDLLIVPLIIPKAGELTMTIYDSRGKEVQKPYSGSIAHGLQQITVYTREFNSGLYVCKVQLDGQTIFTKFIKK